MGNSFLLAVLTVAILASCKSTSLDDKVEKPYNILPGESRVDPVLASDTMPLASIVAAAKVNCTNRTIQLVDTKIDGNPESGNWNELWIFSACGKIVDVPIVFKPDGKGGTFFSISSNDMESAPNQ